MTERVDSLTGPTQSAVIEATRRGDDPGRPPGAGHRARRWLTLAVLGVGLVVLLVSGLSLASAWKADQRTVHALRGPGVHPVRLDARAYQIYSVAGAGGAVAARCFAVNGASGPLTVASHSYQISPYDPANVILQTGTFFPTAGFTVATAGVYTIADRCLAPGQKMFVAETQTSALRHVASGFLGGIVGLGLVIAALAVLGRDVVGCRPSRYLTVVATTAEPDPLT